MGNQGNQGFVLRVAAGLDARGDKKGQCSSSNKKDKRGISPSCGFPANTYFFSCSAISFATCESAETGSTRMM